MSDPTVLGIILAPLALLFYVICRRRVKREAHFPDALFCFVSGAGMAAGLRLMWVIGRAYSVDPWNPEQCFPRGMMKTDLVYLLLASIAVIWLSIQAIYGRVTRPD